MTAEYLLDAMGLLDDDLIAESELPVARRRSPLRSPAFWGTVLAACLALVILPRWNHIGLSGAATNGFDYAGGAAAPDLSGTSPAPPGSDGATNAPADTSVGTQSAGMEQSDGPAGDSAEGPAHAGGAASDGGSTGTTAPESGRAPESGGGEAKPEDPIPPPGDPTPESPGSDPSDAPTGSAPAYGTLPTGTITCFGQVYTPVEFLNVIPESTVCLGLLSTDGADAEVPFTANADWTGLEVWGSDTENTPSEVYLSLPDGTWLEMALTQP